MSRQASGDVKYHQGFSSNVMTPGGEMHLALAFNPSHLEIVGPVAEGSVRARQDRRLDYTRRPRGADSHSRRRRFAGQGVVMETFQMSQTRGFRTGGTIHVIINNQIGFTTSRQDDARSTEYCTEVARMVQAPIFHVNGDDPEEVLFVTQVAIDYRMQFRKDVVIDLVGYRRRGHNEAEEPMTTQPLMYQRIRKQPTTRTIYAEKLVADGTDHAGRRRCRWWRRIARRWSPASTLRSASCTEAEHASSMSTGRRISATTGRRPRIRAFRCRSCARLATQMEQLPEDSFCIRRCSGSSKTGTR